MFQHVCQRDIFFYNLLSLFLPHPLYSSLTASQNILFLSMAEFRADIGVGGGRGLVVDGVILCALVARLAANHFYESTGGQKEAHDFSLLQRK